MNYNKDILMSSSLRKKFLAGVKILSQCVQATYGPKGRNVVIFRAPHNAPDNVPLHVTKDGVTVSKEVILPDNFMDCGARIVNEAARETAKKAGDGTTASIILASNLFESLVDLENDTTDGSSEYVDYISLTDRLNDYKNYLLKCLKDFSRDVKNKDELKKVSLISTNGDEELAELITSAMWETKGEGNVTILPSPYENSFVEKQKGIVLNSPWITSAFRSDVQKNQTRLKKVAIFLYDDEILGEGHLRRFREKFYQGRLNNSHEFLSVLLMVKDADGGAIGSFIHDRNIGAYDSCIIKIPGNKGIERDNLILDLEALTGATELIPTKGVEDFTLKNGMNIEFKNLGYAEEVIINENKTIIVLPDNKTETSEMYIETLREKVKTTLDVHEKEKLKARIANLTENLITLYVSGSNPVDIAERQDRADDAVCATRCAIQEGIVAGGATTLLHIEDKVVTQREVADKIDVIVRKILKKVLRSPFNQLLRNANVSDAKAEEYINDILSKPYGSGFNAKILKVTDDLFEDGIIDPTKVIEEVIKNAFAVVTTLLRTEVCLSDTQPADKVILHGKLNNNIDLEEFTVNKCF